jgi:hypothetical protein
MPRGPAPPWRVRKEPVTDNYLMAAVNQAGGLGKHDPTTGLYSTLIIRGFETREEAKEFGRSLYRCGLWLCRNRDAAISVHAPVKRAGNGYLIELSVYHKVHARAYHLKTNGTDKRRWAYDPTRRGGAR